MSNKYYTDKEGNKMNKAQLQEAIESDVEESNFSELLEVRLIDFEKQVKKDAQRELAIILIGDNLFHKKDYLSINKKDLEAFI